MRGKRVLVLFEAGRGGAAALDEARELAEHDHAVLTVVAVAPQAPMGTCGATSARAYNEAVAESVVDDLESARARLGEVGEEASYRLLIEGAAPSLAAFASGGFDLVLLPARRRLLRAAGHPAAGRLSEASGAEIRVVDARRSAVAG